MSEYFSQIKTTRTLKNSFTEIIIAYIETDYAKQGNLVEIKGLPGTFKIESVDKNGFTKKEIQQSDAYNKNIFASLIKRVNAKSNYSIDQYFK